MNNNIIPIGSRKKVHSEDILYLQFLGCVLIAVRGKFNLQENLNIVKLKRKKSLNKIKNKKKQIKIKKVSNI